MNDFLVSIQDVSKSFDSSKKLALDHLTITIPKGQIVGLVGPDGAGKTTLIRLIAGLLLPSTGFIHVNGYDSIKNSEQIHTLCSYMPQRFGLYEDLTVLQNLLLYADLRNVIGQEREHQIEKLLNFTNLAPFKKRLAKDLSGGMKQKLGLACALIRKPKLLLLDEPSVGVDPLSRRELWKMVQELLKEEISVVWSTAYLDEAEKCHSVILLNEGKMLFNGLPSTLNAQVKERVFQLSNINTNKRALLSQCLKHPDIIDGVIQGSSLRIVTRDTQTNVEALIKEFKTPEVHWEKVRPRFEDAFINLLGGGPGSSSKLAEKTPRVSIDSNEVIEAKELTKKFGSFTAVDHISFQVQRGEIFGLLGPNGAGKSTTFKMMCGLLNPTSGSAYVNGLDFQVASGKARSHIGYMAQKFSLYGNLSVLQNLNFFSGIYQLSGKEKQKIIAEMIEIFNLKNYLNESTETLPLGFKQRLALACALMHHPDVLFLDEPTSGVDPITRREFWNHINGLVEKKVTVLVTTHFMEEAEYCDRIALIYRSKVITIGTPDSLKNLGKTNENQNPSLEEAFIQLIEEYDRQFL